MGKVIGHTRMHGLNRGVRGLRVKSSVARAFSPNVLDDDYTIVEKVEFTEVVVGRNPVYLRGLDEARRLRA